MSKIKIVQNPENKSLKELVDEELKKKEQPKVTVKDLKNRKCLIDKYNIMFLDWLLIDIIDNFFNDERVEENKKLFINRMEFYERQGYLIDNWLVKYNWALDYRANLKRYMPRR